MKILITGGCGFIGSHLAETCIGNGDEVTIIDDLSTGQITNISNIESSRNLKVYDDSIFNISLLSKLISENDIVFHLAAAVGVQLIVNKPVQTIETNVFGTHHVLDLSKKHNKKVLIASTSEIYGKNTAVPFREDSDRILGPTTVSRWSYSSSKAIDEFLSLAYFKEFGLDVIIFRLFNTVGPRQTGRYGMVLPNFVNSAINNKDLIIHGDGSQSRCFCDVSDVIKAILALSKAKDASGQIYNIGSTHEITIEQLAMKVLTTVNKLQNKDNTLVGAELKKRLKFISYEEAYGNDFQDMARRIPNTDKINELTGWNPTISLGKTIERVTNYFLDSSKS